MHHTQKQTESSIPVMTSCTGTAVQAYLEISRFMHLYIASLLTGHGVWDKCSSAAHELAASWPTLAKLGLSFVLAAGARQQVVALQVICVPCQVKTCPVQCHCSLDMMLMQVVTTKLLSMTTSSTIMLQSRTWASYCPCCINTLYLLCCSYYSVHTSVVCDHMLP